MFAYISDMSKKDTAIRRKLTGMFIAANSAFFPALPNETSAQKEEESERANPVAALAVASLSGFAPDCEKKTSDAANKKPDNADSPQLKKVRDAKTA